MKGTVRACVDTRDRYSVYEVSTLQRFDRAVRLKEVRPAPDQGDQKRSIFLSWWLAFVCVASTPRKPLCLALAAWVEGE
jgi:hypothetical protein